MADKRTIYIPRLAARVSRIALELVPGTSELDKDEYLIKQIAEKKGNDWLESYISQVEFADGVIGLFKKAEERDPNGVYKLVFEVSLYDIFGLCGAVRYTGLGDLPIFDSIPEDFSSMQRRLLAVKLTGLVCEEVLPQEAVGKGTLMRLESIANIAGKYLPETNRSSHIKVILKNEKEMRPIEKLDLTKANVFAVEYK